jgi:pimeloyl-ACP methyl ester carboxylesterase
VQWQDLVTTIIAQEKARMLDPVTSAITAAKSGVTAWTSFQSLVKTFSDSAVALREGAIGSVAATGGTTASGRRPWRTSKITSPTLYVIGGASRIVPAATQERLKQTLPSVEIVTMPGLGHYPDEEDTAGFFAVINRFLKR